MKNVVKTSTAKSPKTNTKANTEALAKFKAAMSHTTTTTDSRKRTAFAYDGFTVCKVHDCKSKFVVYITKRIDVKPEFFAQVFKSFEAEAVVNPAFTASAGKDRFAVKVTMPKKSPDDLDKIGGMLCVLYAECKPAPKAKTEPAPKTEGKPKAPKAPAKNPGAKAPTTEDLKIEVTK